MRDLDPVLLERAGELNIVIPGTWGNKRIQQEIDKVENAQLEGGEIEADDGLEPEIHNTTEAADIFQTVEWANERAAKIWEGQSTSLSIIERVGRIKLALKERGFTRFDELVIPTSEDYKKFL